MQQLDSDLWVTDAPLRFLGLEVGARMTIVRLPNDKLLLHSPIAATADLVREVESLGSVAYLIAPNRLHHLFVDDWQRTFPDASTSVAPGAERHAVNPWFIADAIASAKIPIGSGDVTTYPKKRG